MNEQSNYTKRELDTAFKEMHTSIEDVKRNQIEGFNIMHTKQDKTNGRLGRLERWRAYMTGAVAVLGAVILPLLWILINKLFEV